MGLGGCCLECPSLPCQWTIHFEQFKSGACVHQGLKHIHCIVDIAAVAHQPIRSPLHNTSNPIWRLYTMADLKEIPRPSLESLFVEEGGEEVEVPLLAVLCSRSIAEEMDHCDSREEVLDIGQNGD